MDDPAAVADTSFDAITGDDGDERYG